MGWFDAPPPPPPATGPALSAVAGAFAASLVVLPLLTKAMRASARDPPTRVHYEFGGPVGAFMTMLLLPGVIFFLYCSCNKDFIVPGADLGSLAGAPLPDTGSLISVKAVGVLVTWFGFQVVLERLLPGDLVSGVDLGPAGGSKWEGKTLQYRMNGHLAFWVSILALMPLAVRGDLVYLYDAFSELAGASIFLSTLLAAFLYWKSFQDGALLAKGGNSGNAVYDFFIGRELNPRLGTFDLKQFCELRPGLIGWVALNLGMAAKQYHATGAVSAPMLFVNFFQGLYVWDALYQERAILTTMDITTDGFGYMLAFGDLAWVPFTYGVQARYLVDRDAGVPDWALVATACLCACGYAVFRGANGQKDAFRRDPAAPAVAHLKVLNVTNQVTGKPSKLLISGWWGMARKINYTGDWLMALSWSAFTGLGCVITYFYPIYFAVLLVHRAWRDDCFCAEKYGADWNKYKSIVRAVFIPGVI